MTTILADTRFGLMVADSGVSDGERVWSDKKVFRVRGSLIGLAGDDSDCTAVLAWFKAGMSGHVKAGGSSALILNGDGLFLFNANYTEPQRLKKGREAIGTGAMAAMAAYEALSFLDPRKAVQIVCKHDAGSRGPVHVYQLNRTSRSR